VIFNVFFDPLNFEKLSRFISQKLYARNYFDLLNNNNNNNNNIMFAERAEIGFIVLKEIISRITNNLESI